MYSNYSIVTGLSIIKQNRIIQLRVAESLLLPFGKINITMDTDENGKTEPFYRLVSNEEFRITDANIREGSDYHKLSWEHRAIDLDIVTVPTNKVVTGVRFHLTAAWHLSLEVRATDFNYNTGWDDEWLSILLLILLYHSNILHKCLIRETGEYRQQHLDYQSTERKDQIERRWTGYSNAIGRTRNTALGKRSICEIRSNGQSERCRSAHRAIPRCIVGTGKAFTTLRSWSLL